ncbi:adenosylcobinamide-GDP ribazoletransferase [Bacillus solitudinis]|uniref:adenosylcobinamide-GDP ribazoletransferase n=1 Tax=Bacillus solitudinis TaxID=2014074 RepID=UPI000C234BEA|nr:adenosylcobinamide-GDP ribazoletransferase [Bacillus solitudinis]
MLAIKDGILLAFQLLTTIPIRKQLPWDDRRAKWSVAAYPLTGLVLGILLASFSYSLLTFTSLSILIVTSSVVTFSIIFSGGLHLDGWADFNDAIFSRRDVNKKLEIMKDSRIGAFGVLSLLLLLGWRFILIFEMIHILEEEIIFFFLIIPFFTRMIMGAQILLAEFARNNGMAQALQPAKVAVIKWIYGLWFLIGMTAIVVVGLPYLSLFVGALLFLIVWIRFCSKQIGGITGDTIGAGTEGSETWLWLILFLLHSFVMV